MTQGPLSGVRVLDLSRVLAGPWATQTLADLGAEVIKIERPGAGDDTRHWGPPFTTRADGSKGDAAYFLCANRGKKSVALDIATPEGAAVVRELAKSCDVVVENFKTGGLRKYGLDHAALSAVNPKLVYCSISGFGADGPYADRPSYDSVAQALSGFLSVVVDPDRPRFLGPALADAITGIYAAYGVLGALFERSRTGSGRLVEVSMLEAMAHFAVEPFAAFFALDRAPQSSDRPRLAQAYILRTADGALIAIHLSSLEKFWEGLVSALPASTIGSDERFRTRQARIDNYEALGAALDAQFSRHTLQHWAERLGANDVPFAPINRIDQVVQDPQVRHLGLVVPVERAHGGKQAVRPAVQFDGARATHVTTAPLLDEHGADIRRSPWTP